MDNIKPIFTATATATGGSNGHTLGFATEAHEQIYPYSNGTRGNDDVQLEVVGKE